MVAYRDEIKFRIFLIQICLICILNHTILRTLSHALAVSAKADQPNSTILLIYDICHAWSAIALQWTSLWWVDHIAMSLQSQCAAAVAAVAICAMTVSVSNATASIRMSLSVSWADYDWSLEVDSCSGCDDGCHFLSSDAIVGWMIDQILLLTRHDRLKRQTISSAVIGPRRRITGFRQAERSSIGRQYWDIIM